MEQHSESRERKIERWKKPDGGPAKILSEADLLCCKRFGEDNPKLMQIPVGFHNPTLVQKRCNEQSADARRPPSRSIDAQTLRQVIWNKRKLKVGFDSSVYYQLP